MTTGETVASPLSRRRFPLFRPDRAWMAGAALLVALAALSPLGFVLWVAVRSGWETVLALTLRPRVGELLLNTLLLVVITLPLTAALSLALAWLTERSDIPGARFWAWLAAAPLAVPAFVHSYAWITLWPGLNGLFAGVFVSTLAYFPFLYLPVAAALRRLDPAFEDVAASLGHPPLRAFFRVILPQLRIALCGGGLLVGLHLLAEYGLYAMIRFDTFTTAIFDQFQSAYNAPAANMLGGVLVLCCFALLGGEAWLRGDRRFARIGPGAARPPARQRLGRLTVPALILPAGIAALSLGSPLLMLARWLIAGGAAVWRLDEILPAIVQTAALSLAGAVLTIIAAIPMAWLSVRAPGPLSRALESAHYLAGALPGVVIALALVTIAVRVAPALYQTAVTILIAYALIFLPRALIALRASFAQAPVELEQAAASLGRPPGETLRRVTLPLSAPGVAAGAALVALGVANELTATQLLAPNGVQTLATAFWAYSSEIDYAAAAPYALIMILLSLPLVALLQAQSKKAAGR